MGGLKIKDIIFVAVYMQYTNVRDSGQVSFLLRYLTERDFMPPPGRLDCGCIMFSTCPSVRPSVCYQTYEYDISKTNEAILTKIGTNGPRGSGGQRSRSHKVEDSSGSLAEASFSTSLSQALTVRGTASVALAISTLKFVYSKAVYTSLLRSDNNDQCRFANTQHTSSLQLLLLLEHTGIQLMHVASQCYFPLYEKATSMSALSYMQPVYCSIGLPVMLVTGLLLCRTQPFQPSDGRSHSQ